MNLQELIHKNKAVVGDALKARLNEIGISFAALREEESSIRELLSALMQTAQPTYPNKVETSTSVHTILKGYDKSARWIDRAVYLVSISDHPLTTAEMTEMVMKEQPDLNRIVVAKSLSAVLSIDKEKTKLLRRSRNEKGGFVYSLATEKPANDTAGLNEIKSTDNSDTSDASLLSLTFPSVGAAVQ